MERSELEAAFVVHQYPFRETSALVDLLTRTHGRISVVARGVKRPKSPFRLVLQPFSPLLVSWRARGELGTLERAERSGNAPPLLGAALMSGLYLNELVVRLTHRFDPHPQLFDAYADTVYSLATLGLSETSLRRFEKQLLDELGYGLQLAHDAMSGEPIIAGERYLYHPQSGPVRDLGGSRGGIVITGATLLALAGGDELSCDMLREAKQLMRAEIDAHLGHRPLSARQLFRSTAGRR